MNKKYKIVIEIKDNDNLINEILLGIYKHYHNAEQIINELKNEIRSKVDEMELNSDIEILSSDYCDYKINSEIKSFYDEKDNIRRVTAINIPVKIKSIKTDY